MYTDSCGHHLDIWDSLFVIECFVFMGIGIYVVTKHITWTLHSLALGYIPRYRRWWFSQ